jgi:sodium/proline symporter
MLNVTFGINYQWGIVLGSLVIILYTLMGGFMAVCYTDVVQAILMITTLVLLPLLGLIFLFNHGDAVVAALESTRAASSFTGGKTGLAALSLIIGGLSWGFGYMGQPHLVTKFMAIKNAEKIRISRRIATVWTFFAYGGAVLIGIVGIAMIHYGHIDASALDVKGVLDKERILPVLTNFLLPAWMAGVLISGAVAAMMSTADSQLLIATSTVVEDFYSKALKKNISQKRLVSMSRWVTFGIGMLALFVAFTTENIIYKIVTYAWAGLGSAFGPALLMTLYWKKTNSWGVIAGMLTGAITTILWTEISFLDGLISVRFSSFIFAFAAVIVASLLKPRFKAKTAPAGRK